jgi:hypothetical protein
MTISSELTRKAYTGAGTTGPFTVPFRFLADEDLLVIKTLIATGAQSVLTLTTDYTLTGAGEEAGGELTLTGGHGALSSDYRITIINDPDGLQETDYTPYDAFPAETHERALDKLTIRGQRLLDLINRALRQPDGDADDISELPSKVSRASKYLAFNADGDPIATEGTTEENPVSVFVATLLDDVDAAAFLTTLGFSAFIQTLLDDADAATALATLGAQAAATAAKLDTEDQALTGGVIVTSKDLGTISSGTVTPDPGDRPMQHYINGGAHTLGVSANAGATLVDITNNASAGVITTSGFDQVTGDALTTTDGDAFRCSISIGEAGSLLVVRAMQ